MSSRMKEEERIERIIRGLLKLQENRRCINCNSLGPQYVCTTFWTFVCTNCSGVHREFTHRVKSVSMAKFKEEEVSALQAGGNERARQIYFKSWDPQRHSFPDGSNLLRLRDFIKHVYVDRKFTGERSVDKSPMGEEDSYEGRSIERSSPRTRRDERRYYIEERRSPRYKKEKVRSGGPRARPVNFEIVDDRFRDDGSESGRRSESSRFSNADSRAGSRSPDSHKSREMTSPPVVRPVRDILGENVPPLCVGERNKESDGRVGDGSTDVKNTAPSSSTGSIDKKQVEHKRANSGSLIDFNSDPEPSETTAPAIDGGNLALVPSSTNEKASEAPNVNSLESLLFELSAPAVVPVGILSDAAVNDSATSAAPVALSNAVTANASITNLPVVHSTAAYPLGPALALPSGSSHSVFTGGDSGPTAQPTPSVGALYNQVQPWTSSLAPNAQGSSSASAEQLSQPAPKQAEDACSGVGPLALQVVEAKSRERKELPADLFTASYSSFAAPVPSWQVRPPHGMGYGVQYHPTAMPVRPAFPSSAKSTNPFDLNDDSTQVQSPMFPSLSSLQGALPMVSAPTGLLPTSSFGIQSSQLMQSQSSSYMAAMLPQSPSYGMGISPRAFTGQQLPNNVPPPRTQGIGGFGGTEDAFGSLITTQVPSRYPTPTTPNSFSSVGGNPFG